MDIDGTEYKYYSDECYTVEERLSYDTEGFTVWDTRDGRRIKINKMGESHLLNTLNMCKRKADDNIKCQLWVPHLEKEIKRRHRMRVRDLQDWLTYGSRYVEDLDPQGIDDIYGSNTEAAIKKAQDILDRFRTVKTGIYTPTTPKKPLFSEQDPIWLQKAAEYIGEKEIEGPQHHPLTVKMWELIKAPFRDDETPWCAGYVGAVLESQNIISSRSAAARSYLNWGRPCRPRKGAIVVFWRGKRNGWSGHVGFVVGKTEAGHIMVLGGNQGDKVSIKAFSPERVLGYRWPENHLIPEVADMPLMESDGTLSTNEV